MQKFINSNLVQFKTVFNTLFNDISEIFTQLTVILPSLNGMYQNSTGTYYIFQLCKNENGANNNIIITLFLMKVQKCGNR